MDDDIILMNKADSSLTRFYICSPKVANTIYKVILRNERKQKLDYIEARKKIYIPIEKWLIT